MTDKTTFWRLFCISALTFLEVATLADWRDDARFSAGAEQQVKTLSRQIREEISRIKRHDWAGDYYAGDGFANRSLLIAPKHGYVFESVGCEGLDDRNFGKIKEANGYIQLSFTFTNKQDGFLGIASEFIPIRWGKRIYLVPATDMIGFCNAVNSGFEPRKYAYGVYFLRKGDEKKSAFGKPTLPVEYRRLLYKQPIQVTISRIGAASIRQSKAGLKVKDTFVTISAGVNRGFRPGIELYVVSPSDLIETVKLAVVRETDSDGVITQDDDNQPAPKVGWKLSTRAPWR